MSAPLLTAQNAGADSHLRWSIEASTLGLKPGEWPEQIATNLGNGQPFVRNANVIREGELVAVLYLQALGCLRLTIFND